jgi:pSer/pThr/pTyr-binding forkhead associated (FHA) protein
MLVVKQQKYKLRDVFEGNEVPTIGRGATNAIALNCTTNATSGGGELSDAVILRVSRVHARLQVAAGQLLVQDTGTPNGTFVNNQKLEADAWKPLYHDDVISLGG